LQILSGISSLSSIVSNPNEYSCDVEHVAINDNVEEYGEVSDVIFPTKWREDYYILVQDACDFSSCGHLFLSVYENPPERCALASSPLEIAYPGHGLQLLSSTEPVPGYLF
jgi:hypothetical protein